VELCIDSLGHHRPPAISLKTACRHAALLEGDHPWTITAFQRRGVARAPPPHRRQSATGRKDGALTGGLETAAGRPAPDPVARTHRLAAVLRCPACRGRLNWTAGSVACAACQTDYPRRNGRPDFVNAVMPATEDAAFQQERMHHRSLRGRLYDLGQRIITSEYAPFDHRAAFLAKLPTHSVVVELGSGNRRLTDDIVNIDLFMFPNVDAAADIEHTPLADDSVDFVILDSVIEHVPNPQGVVDEVLRVLKPGGKLFCINPFLFPYHGYPAHYCNFTRDGMQHLLRNFSSAVVEPHYGPTSPIVNIVSEYVAWGVAGGRRTPYLAVRAAMLLAIGWLRFLDRWIIRAPQARRLAGMLCSIATK
jgi:SAM-dependent methyltransferase